MRSNIATIKATGERFWYEYKDSWGSRYYSFDDGATWHGSKAAAYVAAKTSGKLESAPAKVPS